MHEIHSIMIGSYKLETMEMTTAQFERYWKAIDEDGDGKCLLSETPLIIG